MANSYKILLYFFLLRFSIYYILQMSLQSQISYYLRIAIDINKKIGGTRAYEAQSHAKQKFAIIRDNLYKDFHFIKTKFEQRQKKKGAQLLGINLQLKQKMEDLDSQLNRMRECISEETNNATRQLKYQIVEKLAQQATSFKQLLQQTQQTQRSFTGIKKNNYNTMTDMKSQLLDHQGKSKNTYRVKSKETAPSQIQITYMKKLDKDNQQIDKGVDQLYQKTKKWKEGVLKTGQLLDQTDAKIQQLTKDVDKVNDNLLRSNKQLKGVVQKFRKPQKFCVDIILTLILIGIIVAIIKVANS